MIDLVIIQARMKSSRFPGKVLAPLHGKPLIAHVLSRIGESVDKKNTVVATTVHSSDDPLVLYLQSMGVRVMRGYEDNVVGRFYHIARLSDSPRWIARVTADCPLIDPRMFDPVIDRDIVQYWGRTNSPDGNDLEVFSYEALESAWLNAGPDETEHVTTWMRKNVKCDSIESAPAYADVHYSVNTVEDLRTCEHLIAECGEGARWQDYVEAYRRRRVYPR